MTIKSMVWQSSECG